MTDLEYIEQQSNKEILASILLGILRYVPVKEKYDDAKYIEELRIKLKFKHKTDADLLRACIDLLEDTESAILEFLKNGLGSGELRKVNNYGEAYLRLYGILNAIYLQLFAIIEFIELFNVPNKKEITKQLKELKIYKIRNAIGAHTINYQIDFSKADNQTNRDFFRIAQITVTKWGDDILLVSSKNKSEQINLLKIINEYIKLTDTLLLAICDKAISSLFKNDSNNKKWLIFRFDFVSKRLKNT